MCKIAQVLVVGLFISGTINLKEPAVVSIAQKKKKEVQQKKLF